MESETPADEPAPSQETLERGPFVLRTLLHNVPLSADGARDDIKINCVDCLGRYPSSLEPRNAS